MHKRYKEIDQAQLQIDIEEIRETIGKPSQEDFNHLKKITWWGKGLALLGYFLVGIIPFLIVTYANEYNSFIYLTLIIGAFFISFANFSRWANLAHPVLHGGYDKIENIPSKYTRKGFANTPLRRFMHWQDWIYPEAWDFEHNKMHHYHLGELEDPDNMQMDNDKLTEENTPIIVRGLLVTMLTLLWKPIYYATNTILALSNQRKKREKSDKQEALLDLNILNPLDEVGFELWTKSYLPYILFRFIALPLLFLPLGLEFSVYVLIASLIAELMTNAHSFLVIAPNHAADDIYQFNTPYKTQGEFYLRQIIGSVNYTTGSNVIDFSHGWLNYQIEHHLFPNLPLSQYQKMQPLVEAVCAKHGIQYLQESVFIRFYKTVRIMLGLSRAPSIDCMDNEEAA